MLIAPSADARYSSVESVHMTDHLAHKHKPLGKVKDYVNKVCLRVCSQTEPRKKFDFQIQHLRAHVIAI